MSGSRLKKTLSFPVCTLGVYVLYSLPDQDICESHNSLSGRDYGAPCSRLYIKKTFGLTEINNILAIMEKFLALLLPSLLQSTESRLRNGLQSHKSTHTNTYTHTQTQTHTYTYTHTHTNTVPEKTTIFKRVNAVYSFWLINSLDRK